MRVTFDDIQRAALDLGVQLVDEPIQPGDSYLAGRNTNVVLLTCNKIEMGCIFPVEKYQYPYDIHECHKITC